MAQTWRSALYPSDWEPGYQDNQGRFLHDFSYAGYRNGEHPIPTTIPGIVVDAVLECNADPSGQTDATQAIQAAIQKVSLAGGGIVYLPTGLYRCDGLLLINQPGIVLRGDGLFKTKLQFTKVVGMSYKSHILFKGSVVSSTDMPLRQDAPQSTKEIFLQTVGDLKVGDDISIGWVITEAFIAEHGMTGTWKAFNNQWQPFFLRKIVEIDEAAGKVVIDVPTRYIAKTRDQASIRKQSKYLKECGLESLSIGNAGDWESAWQEKSCQAISMEGVKDCWIKDVASFGTTSYEAKSYHLQSKGIRIADSKRVTVTGCKMENAQNRGENGNGYLFEITRCSEVLIEKCFASAGRHNFIQNWGFGTTGCVFLQCTSQKGWSFTSMQDKIGVPGFCEYHHSIATACLVDQCYLKDGWYGGNRRDWSTGAGHSVTQSVYWNIRGDGLSMLLSWQYGYGYVIGAKKIIVVTALAGPSAEGTSPEDWVENPDGTPTPESLYLDQLSRRLTRGESVWSQD